MARTEYIGNIFGRGALDGIPGVIDPDIVFDSEEQIYKPKKEPSNVINKVTKLPIEPIKVIKRKVSPHRMRNSYGTRALAV